MILINISQYDIEIKRREFIRAMERGITPDMIEATIKGGTVKRFGKNNMKFIKKYKHLQVICVDEIIGHKIKIVTIEKKG